MTARRGSTLLTLLGRIAWVESLNPARGAKLRTRFGAIDWTHPHEGVRPLNNSKRRVEPNRMLRGLTPP